MNGDEANNKKLLVAFMAVLALTGTCLAAHHGGHGNGGGRGGHATRQTQMNRGGGHATKAAQPYRTAQRTTTRAAAGQQFHPVQQTRMRTNPQPRAHIRPNPQPRGHFRPAPRHHMRPHPVGARFWARPVICPPPRYGAFYDWTWVDEEWEMYIDGVLCYGDGYYFDGCNYYYNGAYYTTPPVLVAQAADLYW